MDEQTKQALSEFIRKALEATEKAGEFAVEQAPLVVQEYIARGFAGAAFRAFFSLVLLIMAVLFLQKGISYGNPEKYDHPGVLGLQVGSATLTVVSAVWLYKNAYAALMIYVAPRVYVIESLRGML